MIKKTVEEKLLLLAYDYVISKNDLNLEIPIEFFEKEGQINKKKLSNIIKILIRSGFFKKEKNKSLTLTSKGISIINNFLKKS